MLIRLLALSCWAVATCYAGPLRQDGISRDCRSPSPMTSQQTILYTYVGENRIENQDAQHHVQVKANVEVGVISPCIFSFKMADVDLQGVSVANRYAFKEALERHPLTMYIEDGIVGEIRHHPEELPWALNVKRAIISMMQIPRSALDANSIISETDVFGTCETRYTPGNVGRTGGTVTKSKNLATCFGRFGSSLPIIYTPYEAKASPFQTIPMTNGSFICQQTVDANRWITKAECKEQEFLHLAARGLREQTTFTSTGVLIMQQIFPSVKPVPETVNVKSTIKFDHSVTRAEKTEPKEVIALLRDLCRSTHEDIRPEASGIFARLVADLRGLPPPALRQIYSKVSAGELCFDQKIQHLFLDALPLVGTEASLKLTVELINKAEHADRSMAWIAGISSISYPTEGMISILVPLVKKSSAPRSAILAVTSLAHVFCRGYHGNCDDVPAIRELQSSLTKQLGFKCRADDVASRNKIITALKGFGNLGYYGEGINTIIECAISGNSPLPIRIAAIQATRRACAPEMHPKLLELMKTPSEDVEIRIAAYLGIMSCPTMKDVIDIKKMLEKEEINQVGSFIWSHLKNLQSTESPTKMALRSLVSGIYVPGKFDSDARKSSQNIEWSELSEKYNVGGTAEANIVYSPKSFIPRSIDLNLTVDLFSHSINIFEVGGRAEGYDHMLESLLAPKSQLRRTNEVDSFWNRLGDKLSRSRRAASAKNTRVDIFDDKVNIVKANQPSGSLYFRMFGNELSWLELPTMDDIANFANGVQTNSWLDQIMSKKQNDIARSAMLVDTTVTVPTVTGFPFRIDLKATVTGGLKTDGQINLANAPGDMLIEGFIKPSASIDMSGLMSIDAGVAKRGIRVSSTMHTSTALDGKIEIKPTGEMNFKYNIRNDKQEILNMKTEIYSVEAETETPLMAPSVKEFNGCTQTLSKALGLSICTKGKVPKPFINYRGLNLPFDFSIILQKNDLAMEGYEIKMKYPMDTSSPNLFYQFIFDTPGSAIQRKHLIELAINKPFNGENTMHFLYHCPMKKIEVSTSLKTHSSPAHAMLEAKVDDTRRYFIKLDVPYGDSLDSVYFEPRLEMSCPATAPVIVQGRIDGSPSGFSINLQSNMPAEKPAYLRASLSVDEKKLQADLSTIVPLVDINFNSLTTKPQEGTVVTAATLEYQRRGQRKQTVKLNAKTKDLSTEHISKSAINAEMQFSEYPEYNWKVTTDFQKAPGAQHNEHDIKLWWGENLDDQQRHIHVLTISKQIGEYGHGYKASSEGRLVVFAPVWDIDFNGLFNAMLDLQDVSKGTFNGEIQSHGERVMQIEMNHNLERSPPRLLVNARVETRHFRFLYSDQLEERNPNQYVGRTNIEWGREGKSIATEYVIISRRGADSSLHDIEYKISYPGMRMPAVHRTKIRTARGTLDATSSTEVNGRNILSIAIQNTPKLKEFRFDSSVLEVKLSKATKAHSTIYVAELRPLFAMINAFVATAQIKDTNESTEVQAELLWDADRYPDRKMRLSANGNRIVMNRRPAFHYGATFQYCNDLSITASVNYSMDIARGPHFVEFGIGGTDLIPRTVSLSYTRLETSANVMFGYTLGGADQIRIEYNRNQDSAVQQFDLSATSIYPELNGKRLTVTRSLERPISVKIQYEHAANEIYGLELRDSSGGNRINTNLKIRTPLPHYASGEFRISGDYSTAVTNIVIEAVSSSSSIYRLVFNYELTGNTALTTTLTLETPHADVRNAKLSLRIIHDHATMEGQLLAEVNDRVHFNLAGNVRTLSPHNFDGRISLKSSATVDIEAVVSSRSSSPLNGAFELKLIEAGTEVIVASLVLNDQPSEFTGRLDLSGTKIQRQFIQVGRKIPAPEHRIYSLTAGHANPLITFIIDTMKQNDVRITTIKYQPHERPEDWASITIEKNDWHREHEKLIVTIEPKANIKTTFDFLYLISKDTIKSKFIWTLDDIKLGYDLKSRADGEHAYNSLLKILYLRREIDVHNRYTHTPDSLELSTKVLLNAVMMPDRALEMTYRHNRIQNGWEATAILRHPTFSKDIVFSGQIQRDISESTPLLVSAQLQPGDASNRIYFNLVEKLNEITATNKSVHIHIHHEDRNLFDVSLTTYHTITAERPIFGGYYWSWTTQRQGPKRGHATFFVGRNGVARFDYDSILGKWTASGQSQRASNGDETVDIVVQGEREQFTGRIIYNLRRYRFEGLTFDSQGKTSRSLEVSASNSTRNAALKVELSHFEDNNKMTDFSYSFEKRGDKAYRSKLFFPPEKMRAIQMAVNDIEAKLSDIDISDFVRDIAHMAEDSGNYLDRNFASPFINMLLDEFGEIMGEAVIALSDILYESPFGELIAHWQRWIDNVLKTLAEQIKSFIEELVRTVQSAASLGGHRRHRRDVSQQWDELGDYVSRMWDNMWNAPLVRQVVRKIDDAADYVTDKFRETMYRIRRTVGDVVDAIKENPDYRALESTISELYEPGMYQSNTEFWKNLQASLENTYKTSDVAVVREADRKNGKYIVDFNLPADLDTIRQNWHEWLAEDDAIERRPRESMDAEPAMVDYLSSMFQRKWMPPFDGQAMIIGHQHFVTFDGTIYSATGDCTYLLARDFVDGNFTVLLKYHPEDPSIHGRFPKSIIVQLGQSYIEIFPNDGSMFLNGQAVDLPLILEGGDVIARRVGDVITVEDEKALRVSCHLYYDVCTVKINGWYFGNTAGLLGTYNNERGDDLMKPKGQVTSNVAQFVKKWETSRSCKGPVSVLNDQVAVDSEGYKLCENYFKDDDSPLADGFWQESPEPYFDLCLRHMATPRIDPRQAICNISMAYLLQLEKYSISANLPSECYTCSLPGGETLKFGDFRTTSSGGQRQPTSMDIVLVVEEDACHADVVRELDSTMRIVDREMLSAGFQHNRFALVGFGHGSGHNSQPHVRTARGSIFFLSPSLPLATQKMRLDAPATSGGHPVKKDVFDAIRYASLLPFRPNVAKAIIVVACADCKEEQSELSYSDIQTQLLDHGITLHFISDKRIEVRKSIIKGKGIYGLDADSVYSSKDVSQKMLLGQPDLRPQVAVPKDICIALAQEVHGSFFSSATLRSDAKNWKTVFARRITKALKPAKQLGGTEDYCERCECTHGSDVRPQVVCRPCRPLPAKVPLALYTADD
ncbi:apolipophorins-like [Dermacentor andersoni]|uniref:apolipophorins-like n=1 Tax=Dermacentor andersoni TaxID=34620 RepID=UPI002155E8BB|nr:apolipophorins-like [Dermacentor andersoni]